MSFFSLRSWLKRRPFLGSNTSPRRGKRRAHFTTQFIRLEDRVVPAAPTLVANPAITSLSQVLATPPGLPEKYVTITNNANYPVYPIFYDANSTVDPTANAGTATLNEATPNATKLQKMNIVVQNQVLMPIEGRFTIQIDGEQMRVIAGASTNVWTVLRGYNGTTPAPHGVGARVSVPTSVSLYDPLDPLNQTYRGYVGEAIGGQVVLGLQPGHQLTVQVPLAFWDGGRLFFAYNNSTPLNAGDPGDPTQANGTVLTYNNTWHYNPNAPSFMALANFNDPAKGAGSNNPDGRVLWYHDPSDKTTAPNIGPFDFGTDGPGQLSEWTIRDPKLPIWAPNTPKTQVQTIFNYDVSYVDNLTLPAAMEITNVPIKTPPNYNGPVIPTDTYGWLGSDLSIKQMQDAMNLFTATDPAAANTLLGSYFGGRGYDQFFEPTGLGPKLPAGYNLIALAPNNFVASNFDATKYQLTSGGSIARVPTDFGGSTLRGIISTVGSPTITNLDPKVIRQLAAGMLNIDTDFFSKGTVILSVDSVNNSVTLSTGSLKTSNGTRAFTFAGSSFTSTGTPAGNQITIDPAVGIDLAIGMVVLWPSTTGRVTITNISTDFKTVTLSGPAGAGPYTFQGAPASYVVSTLINNWYAWANYYVANNTAVPLPNVVADAGRVGGNSFPIPDGVTAGSREDPNMLVLKNLPAGIIGQLRVGDVVTGPGILPDSNPLVPFKSTTIASIDVDRNLITLSNPLNKSGTGQFSFTKPVAIPKSVDAKPYTLSFAPGTASDDALKFAQSVYDVMAGWAHLTESSYLSQSALLLNYIIGGNIGTFALQAGESLPTLRLDELRDELKSVLRGVYDFSKKPEFDKNGNEQWYPDPKDGNLHPAMITPFGGGVAAPANFGVYNLNPYVWFIHIELGMSGYGFSLDDDTANAQDRANSLEATFGTTQNLKNLQDYTYGAPFGRVSDTGFIDTTSGFAKGYDLTKFTVISGLSVATVGKLNAFDAKQGQGALVFGKYLPKVARVFTTAAFPLDGGKNDSHVVLSIATPAELLTPTKHNGDSGPYTFAGFNNPLPSIKSFSPTAGSTGTIVKILPVVSGGFKGVTGVTFNGIPVINPTITDSLITATVPGGNTTGPIAVRAQAGTAYSPTNFIFGLGGGLPSGPVVDPMGLDKTSGSLGTVLTITGSGLSDLIGVTFDGSGTPVDATEFTANSDTSVTVTVPIGATTGTVTVHTLQGNATSAQTFTVNPPAITSQSINSGPVGVLVVFGGSGFTGTSGIVLDDGTNPPTAVTDFSVVDDTLLTLVVPNVPSGVSYTIKVTTSGGTGASPTQFNVTPTVAPAIASFSPPSGPVGTFVSITGSGFTGTSAVTFNGTPADDFTVIDDDTLWVFVPLGATTGPIVATNSAGNSAPSTDFTVTPTFFPSIVSLSPTFGGPGTLVVLTGDGFASASDVSFGGTSAPFFASSDDTILTFVPFGATTGFISVTNPSGTAYSPTVFTPQNIGTLPYADTFSQDDHTPLDAFWTVQRGSWLVESGAAQATAPGASVAVLTNLVAADTTESAIIPSLANGQFAALVARYQGVGDKNMYQAGVRNTNGVYTAEIYKNVANTWTLLASSPISGLSGSFNIQFDTVGSSLRLYVNGLLTTTAADSTFSVGTLGMRGLQGVSFGLYSAAALTPTALPYNEDFTSEPNGALSSNWFTQSGSVSISNGNAVATGTGKNVVVLNSDPSTDVSGSTTVTALPSGALAALIARYQGAGDTNMYQAGIRNTNGSYTAEIYKNVNGTWTALTIVPILNIGINFTMRFDVVGNSLKLFASNNQVASATDSTFASGVAGLRLFPNVTVSRFSATAIPNNSVQPAALPFTDNLTTTGPLAPTWGTAAGAYFITGGHAIAQNPGSNVAILNGVAGTDTTESVTVTSLLMGQFAGLVARYQGPGDAGMYQAGVRNTGGNYTAEIYKNVNGTWSLLTSVAATGFTPGNTDNTLRFDAVGSSLRLYINGAVVAVATDNTFAAGSVGLRGLQGAWFSQYSATAITATALPYGEDFTSDPDGPLSSSWFTQKGSVGISSGNLVASGFGTNLAVLNSDSNTDESVSATVTALPSGALAALVARYQGAGDANMYQAGVRNTNGTYTAEIYVNQNGSWTALAIVGIANPGTTFTVRFDAVGTAFTLLVNGAPAARAADATFATGVTGVRLFQNVALSKFSATTVQAALLPFFDGFPVNGALTPAWAQPVGSFVVGSGQAISQMAGINLALLNNTTLGDSSTSVSVNSLQPGQFAGLVARYQGSGDTNMYQASVRNNNGNLTAEISKNVNGTWTLLSIPGAPATGFNPNFPNSITFDTIGSSLRLYINGQVAAVVTDSTFATGAVGLRAPQGVPFSNYVATAVSPVRLPYVENFPLEFDGPLAPSWFTQVGSVNIVNGSAVGTNAGINLAVLNSDPISNESASATVSALPSNSLAALVARYQGSGDTNMYQGLVRNSNGSYTAEIYKNVNGTWTQLASVGIANPFVGGSFNLELDAFGTSLTLSVNSTTVATATDSSFTSGVTGVRLNQNVALSAFSSAAL